MTDEPKEEAIEPDPQVVRKIEAVLEDYHQSGWPMPTNWIAREVAVALGPQMCSAPENDRRPPHFDEMDRLESKAKTAVAGMFADAEALIGEFKTVRVARLSGGSGMLADTNSTIVQIRRDLGTALPPDPVSFNGLLESCEQIRVYAEKALALVRWLEEREEGVKS